MVKIADIQLSKFFVLYKGLKIMLITILSRLLPVAMIVGAVYLGIVVPLLALPAPLLQ